MRSQPRFSPAPHPNHSAQRLDIHRGISPPTAAHAAHLKEPDRQPADTTATVGPLTRRSR